MINIKEKNCLTDILFKILILFIAFTSAILFPKLGWWAANYFGLILGYQQFSIGWDIVHHIVQLLPAIAIMLLPIWGKNLSDWGFNNIEKDKTKQIIIKFSIGFIIFFTLGKIFYMWINEWPWILDFDQDVKSVRSVIIYRFILPGFSEELLFRAYTINILMLAWKDIINLGAIKIPVAGIISAIIFVVAHIGFNLFPFQIIYFNTGQLIFAFLFGVFYAKIFYDTKSILAPMFTHNIIDGMGTLIDYLLTLVFLK